MGSHICLHMAWPYEYHVAEEAHRLTSADRAQDVAALLHKAISCYRQDWPAPLVTGWIVGGVLRCHRTGACAFPEKVFRALMQARTPDGSMLSFDLVPLAETSQPWYLLQWVDPGGEATWLSVEDGVLQGFAKAWLAEKMRWSGPRAAWVAAAV